MDKYIFYAIFYCVFVFSGTLHEVGHAWSAYRLGDPTARDEGRININPLVHIDPLGTVIFPLLNLFLSAYLIGWMKPVPVDTSRLRSPVRDSLLVSLAGPYCNLILAFGCFTLLLVVPEEALTRNDIWKLLVAAVQINLVLAFFNLLPVPPLDGSSIVDYIRGDRDGSYHRQAGLGMILLYAMLFLGVFGFLWTAVDGVMNGLGSVPAAVPTVFGLLVFCGIVFWFKTSKARRRGGARRGQPRSAGRPRAGSRGSRQLARAWKTAMAIIEGREISEDDRRRLEKLRKDRGDGQPLCAPVSFDLENEFCQHCLNVNRCILRAAEQRLRQHEDTDPAARRAFDSKRSVP